MKIPPDLSPAGEEEEEEGEEEEGEEVRAADEG